MSETLLEFPVPVRDAYGQMYHARACAGPMDATLWEGWLEFDPIDGGDTIRSRRETTQPNRTDAEYWATGLSQVYLEGALKRALEGPIQVPVAAVHPPVFSAPAPAVSVVPAEGITGRSILDPFSVYEKGEPLLRKQLAALSAWHLVNIIVDYELTDTPVETLNLTPPHVLIDVIVRGVKHSVAGDAIPTRRGSAADGAGAVR